VFDSYTRPGTDPQPYWDRAWAGALTLILIVMILNLIGRLIARRFAPKTGR
jgi:phosphate transport system permease protein